MQITLFKNNSPNNYIDKTLTTVATVNGNVLDAFDYSEPNLRIAISDLSSSMREYNYFGINGHYYYLTNLTIDPAGITTLTGSLDVLMTYNTYVKALIVRAERSSSHNLESVPDDNAMITPSTTKQTYNFPNPIPDDSRSGCFILTTAQAGY